MNSTARNDKQQGKASSTKQDGVRLRGSNASRLETFMDATFAFVLTLLVISFDELPANYEQMITAIKRIPAFLVSFTILMSFWLSHRGWSRRYGLESGYTIFLSLALMFVVLVYVYPLRIMFESMFAALSGGFFVAEFTITSRSELRGMFIYYSTGSLIMSAIFAELYRAALKRKEHLGLSADEVIETKKSISEWSVVAFYSAISIVLALFLSPNMIPLAGYVYFLIYPSILLCQKILWPTAKASTS